MKDEAMGKLKELGNTILGNFGMSLNDFKMSQNPETGSWSIGSVIHNNLSMIIQIKTSLYYLFPLELLG